MSLSLRRRRSVGKNWLAKRAIDLQEKCKEKRTSKTTRTLAKTGGEEEEEKVDDFRFMKETKFGENWLAKRAIKLHENTRSSVQQEPTRRNKEGVTRGTGKSH